MSDFENSDYPRPLLRRAQWTSLDGPWSFALDDELAASRPTDVAWTDTIEVPFAVETSASEIGDTSFHRRCWYERTIDVPADGRTLVHFNAVDYSAVVYIDDRIVGEHEGAYSGFTLDLLAAGVTPGEHRLSVRVDDDPHDLDKPRGKQDWELEPHSIFYERTTGIWQTVWMETVPIAGIASLTCHADFSTESIVVSGRLHAPVEAARLTLWASSGEHRYQTCLVVDGDHFEARLTIDEAKALAWSPESPTLVDIVAEVALADGSLDRAETYCAFRTVATEDGRFLLNGRPYYLRMVLDQGYWPETGLTPPDTNALRHDVELTKELGFNGVRKHQKIEDERYLYWADRLGLVVWEELPSARRYSPLAEARALEQWPAIVRRDIGHPSVVAWMTFNESWGIQQIATHRSQQAFVRAMYDLTRSLDSTRPIIANDGWENFGGDVIGIHDYRQDASAMLDDYTAEALPGFLHRGIPALNDKAPCVDDPATESQTFGGRRCVMLTELGGVGFTGQAVQSIQHPMHTEVAKTSQQAWGYAAAGDAEDFAAGYRALMQVLGTVDGVWGFCYTQLTDTYQEVNGLLHFDRRPKLPINVVQRATAAVWPGDTLAERLAGDRSRSSVENLT